jgi:hypothetical protein
MSISESLKENRCAVQSGCVSIVRLRDGSTSGFDLPRVLIVTAYKLDLFYWDQVRVCFECSDGSAYDISEDDDGFLDVLHAATECLSGFPPADKWMPTINAPPFARNETRLWPPSDR